MARTVFFGDGQARDVDALEIGSLSRQQFETCACQALAEQVALFLVKGGQLQVRPGIGHVARQAVLHRCVDGEHIELVHLAEFGREWGGGGNRTHLPAGHMVGLAKAGDDEGARGQAFELGSAPVLHGCIHHVLVHLVRDQQHIGRVQDVLQAQHFFTRPDHATGVVRRVDQDGAGLGCDGGGVLVEVRGEGFAIDASVIKADANRARGIPGSEVVNWGDGQGCSRAVREYLDAPDAANPVSDGPDDGPSRPAETRKNVSLTDPAARWTAAPAGPAFFAYSTNYLIDLAAGIIVDVEATPAFRTDEVESTRTMLNRVEQLFDLKPRRLVGDMAYGAASMLGWLVHDKRIEPHVPVWDKTSRTDGSLSVSDFQWHADRNEYICPAGHPLRSEWRQFANPRTHITNADTVIYRANQKSCAGCSLKENCCPNTPHRKIARSIYEDARNVARTVYTTPAYAQSRRDRKKVEMLFAHLKRILKLDRLRLRGMSGAHDEFLLAAAAQNLRRMAKKCWTEPEVTPV